MLCGKTAGIEDRIESSTPVGKYPWKSDANGMYCRVKASMGKVLRCQRLGTVAFYTYLKAVL